MKPIKIYTNEISVIKDIKDSNVEVINKLPETKEEIEKSKEAYANILYVIDLELMKDEEINKFCTILESSSKNEGFKLDFSTEGIILINASLGFHKFNEINISKLTVDKSMALKLISTMQKLSEYENSTLMISSFIESFNEEIFFYESLKSKTLDDIKECLGDKLNNFQIKDKDIKLVIIANNNLLNQNAQKDLRRYVKGNNNYSEISIIEFESEDEILELYCFKDKLNFIDIYSNISTLKNTNELRYVRFNDLFNTISDIYIVEEEADINKLMIPESSTTGFPITIATKSKTNLINVNAVIPEEYIGEYLSVLENFYSKKVIITMADISWVTDFTKGKLTYYKKLILTNIEESIEIFKQEIGAVKLSGYAILFVMKEDLNVLNKYLTVLDEMYPNLNISCFMPRKIYGKAENYVQLFIFEGDL